MKPIRIFISSVQKEFSTERAVLRDYLRGDALMRRFFEPFLFEDVPAADRRADELYLAEVEQCDIYLGSSLATVARIGLFSGSKSWFDTNAGKVNYGGVA